MKRTTRMVLAAAALVAPLLAAPVAGTGAATAYPDASASPPAQAMPDTQPVTATARDNGVRVSMAWEEPLTAGEPTYLRTTVTNTRDTPIWWLYGTSGLSVQAVMPGLERRVGEPVVPLDFGDPDTLVIDLKNNLTDFGKHLRTRLALPLELDEVQGLRRPGGGDVGLPPERVRPGGTLEFVHRWDGALEFEQDQPGDVGLPPSGPVEVTGTASYALEPDGKVRSTEVRLETSVVGGWDEQHLDPLEVVDAVMADPGSAALLADADLSRYDTGIILFDTEEHVWYVGTCGRMSTDDPVHWRLARVDPVSGEVLGLIDGVGTKSCDAGTWPGGE
jgi:hypothetical protein